MLLLPLLFSLSLAFAFEQQPPLLAIGNRPFFGLSPSPSSFAVVEDDSSSTTNDNFISTNVDQFSTSTSNGATTFQQRYFVNSTYSTGKGYHFLFIEGEYTASPKRVSDPTLPHMVLAKDQGATVWSLEHRFYGKSMPFTNISIGNLTYLSSEQAVEDVAQFIQVQNVNSSTNKWIVWGGSYSANLALWVRQKYPNLTAGVVSSSALIMPTLDYPLFQKNVDDTYESFDINCYNAIASATLTVRQLLQYSDGRDQLTDSLKLFPSLNSLNLTYNDLQFFEFQLANVFRVPVMYNRINVAPFSTGCGVMDVCAIMTNASQTDDLQRIADTTSYVYTQLFGGFYGLYNNYTGAIEFLKNDTASSMGSRMRVWLWQACNEFGWSPTTDQGRGLFFSSIPNNFFLNLCEDVFNSSFNIDHLKAGINITRSTYNTSNVFTGTNAVISVGGADPWRHLGINQTSDSTSIAYWADGMAHVGDLQPASSNDSYGVTHIREIVTKRVKSWLNGGGTSAADTFKVEMVEKEKVESVKVDRQMKPFTGSIHFNVTNPALLAKPAKKAPPKFSIMNKLSFPKQLKKRVERLENMKIAKGEMPLKEAMSPYYMFGYVMQDLDHFDDSNNDRFQQYFIYNNEYRQANTNIHFLMISGEDYLDWFYVSPYMQMLSWARHWNATIYCLEHRFYGYSQPKRSVATRYLKWLTVEQALADIAAFINGTNQVYNYTSSHKWVAFGGSYAGNLAAWFRLKYPQLTVGAIASSAPVQLKTDFFEYLQVVENSTIAFGGSKCANNVAKFFKWAQQALTTKEGRMKISRDFYMCDAWCEYYIDEKDAELLMAYMIFDLSTYVQYDDQGHDYVEYICESFADEDEDVGADNNAAPSFDMIKISKLFNLYKNMSTTHLKMPDWSPDSNSSQTSSGAGSGVDSNGCTKSEENSVDTWWCNDISYDEMIEYYQATNYDWFDTNQRCWTWQACTELGYHQSTNYGYGLFNSALPVNFAIGKCIDIFGDEFNRTATDGGVRNGNWLYGGSDNYNGTNVVFVNGSEDPWHVLSVYKPDNPDPNANVTSILITGTSHCEDMYHQEQYDKAGLKAARKQIKKVLKTWLD